MEAPVPGAPERPVDILVLSWKGLPLSIDFSVTPTAHLTARGPSAELLLDTAAVGNQKERGELCGRLPAMSSGRLEAVRATLWRRSLTGGWCKPRQGALRKLARGTEARSRLRPWEGRL